MQAGKLRNYITIEQPTEAFDSNGELILTWSTFAEVWAEILPLIGREFYSARQVNAELTGKIRLRFIKGITAKMRVLYENKTYEIDAPPIDPENRHKELVLLVKEI
jgi:SPP1 family predicted phage head-tail adaptor